jgi:cAMP-binding proteins - catabolite gene activator and regulatory subunit of cAMP-dependent protein kinases
MPRTTRRRDAARSSESYRKDAKHADPAGRQSPALKNHLLAALPAEDFSRIEPLLEPVSCKTGQILYEPNKRIDYAYFPTTTVVSLLYIMENGSSISVSVTGNDGMIGVAPFMEAETVPNEAIVQCPGEAFRIRYRELEKEFRQGGVLQTLLLRFTMALLDQTAQTAACNRLHSIEKQFCRWLLLTHDRLDSDTLRITHELIAGLLGVSREAVTLAVKKLKQKRLIKSVRGNITIIDRKGMEAVVCECYRRINVEYDRLLGRGISRTFK